MVGDPHKTSGPLRWMGVRLLIAEDNLVNQGVILSQVENLGYEADVVANGSAALDALARATYALVLMDCHMPVMDGLTATAEIRRREGSRRYTPIIAVTANGDRDQCLIAGMDDYLAKPVRQQELADAIARWLTHRPLNDLYSNGTDAMTIAVARKQRTTHACPDNKESNRTPKAANDHAFGDVTISERLDQLREECGAEMVAGFVSVFITDTSERMKRLQELADDQDSTAVEREAHGLKGSCANLGVESMAELCRVLEAEAESGLLKSTKYILERLDFEFERLKPLLESEKGFNRG